VSFTTGLLLVGLALLLVIIIIHTLKEKISNKVIMLITIVASSLLYVFLEFLHEESHIFDIAFGAIFFSFT
jgi:Na+/melibiose symporter-like transporter